MYKRQGQVHHAGVHPDQRVPADMAGRDDRAVPDVAVLLHHAIDVGPRVDDAVVLQVRAPHQHDAAEVAADGVRQSARKAEAAIQDATASGKELYRDAADRAGRSLAGIDTLVARNPVGALVAALGIGLVLGLMARK